MDRCSALAADFLALVDRWLDDDREIFVIVRFPNAGGSRSYEHFASLRAFNERLTQLPPSTSVVVCKGHHLTLRGYVDNAFITTALNQIADGAEWTLVRDTIYICGAASWYPNSTGDTIAELESDMRDDTYFGQPVRVGIAPLWWEGDSETIISAFVPNPDGSITPAAY